MRAGRTVVTVWLDTIVEDDRGNFVPGPSTDSVDVRCWIAPVSTTENPGDGYEVVTLYRIYGNAFPGGAWSRVTWRGQDYDAAGEVERYQGFSGQTVTSRMIKSRVPIPSGG